MPFALFVLANQPSKIPGWAYVIAIIMAHGNSAVNPILYGATNKKFRDGYRYVLGQRQAVEPHLMSMGGIRRTVASMRDDTDTAAQNNFKATDHKMSLSANLDM